ncbi:zinc finger protein 407 [Clupea harengus]|uniref:Zinc finger protein 407 n=1 Tax=Clupea harengus TaxID=7950 RepID=A0A6P3VMF6_CLUHA|nr:zinc finger protein 407 [Clupea harengus]
MDTRPKRKLRSAKELTEDGNKDEEPHSDPGSSSRVETEAAEIPTTPSKEDEVTSGCSTSHRPEESQSSAVQDSGEHKQPNIAPTKERDDDCTCSLCDFVAKTPTALKIHAKRKHFRRGGGSRSESAQGRKTNKEVSKAVSVTAKRRDDKKSSQHEEHNPQAIVTLTSRQQDESAVADCKDSGLPPPGEAVSSEEQTESTESRHVSPTQLLLEMVDPSAGGTGQVLDGKEMSSTEEIREHGESQTKSEPSSDTFKESDLNEGECPKKIGKRGPKPRTVHACTHCGHEFRDKPSLVTHVKRRHTKEMSYFCELCSYACVAKCDYEKHCVSNKHKRRVAENSETSRPLLPPDRNETEEQQDQRGGAQATPTRAVKRSASGRPQLQCGSCAFRASTSALLESHARLKHPAEHRFHCKACHYYTATTEGMEAHLAGEAHQRVAKEKNIGASYEDCVEKVLVILSQNVQRTSDGGADADGEAPEDVKEAGIDEMQEAEQAVEAVSTDEKSEDGSPAKRKRGRPKVANVTTCHYCGLVASNATNLSVHIRRRHSHQYSYACKLCSYYCVTKGDMDRHCVTKKHLKRSEAAGSADAVVQVLSVNQAGKDGEDEAMQVDGPDDVGTSQSEGDATMAESVADSETPSQTTDKSDAQSSPNANSFPLKKSKYDSVNSCAHCDFVAHSIPSLELHVKRKHTKDFEFVCLACNYYAVTRREMSRHASTDKHKQKSQLYQERSSGKDVDASNNSEKLRNAAELVVLVEPPATEQVQASEAESEHCESVPDQTAVTPNAEVSGDQVKETVTSEDGVNDEKVSEIKGHEVAQDSAVTEDAVTIKLDPNDTETVLDAPPVKDTLERETEPEEEGLDDYDEEEEDLIEGKCDGSFADKQLVRAIPFDSCIIALKGLQEGESTQQDGITSLGGATSSIMVTGVSSPMKVRRSKSLCPATRGLTPGQRIRCEDCGFMADGLSGLNVHISMKHPSKDKHFHCLLCGKSFYTESNLHQHLTSAAHLRNEQASIEELPEGGATFKCVKCNDPFETEQELFVHIKEKHEELLREVNKYVLEDTEQINREREENQGSVCKHCGKVCKSSNSMAFLAHVRTHTGSKPFRCKICNFATAQLGDARNHVKRHLGMREYKCHVCGWAFVMKKHLSTHLLGKHGVGRPKERKYECDLCDRSFSERWALNNHMKLHTGDKPFKCAWPSCHYAFLTLSAMKDHYRTHTGEKSFLCDLCGFAGGTRHALTKHRRQHTGERPFRCHLCNFASTTQSHLTRHKRVHTGEKPYRCPWCDYRSNCAENIRKHILHTGKHEGVKMYNCPKCDYATNAPMEFRNHLKEMHADIENPDLAYLHAGIVSKSFECRLKGQGASFVQAETVFIPEDASSSAAATLCRIGTSGLEGLGSEAVQQVIIIQGYDGSGGNLAVEQALEESAAATLQTLAMGGQVAEVLHITEDGQLITSSGRPASAAGTTHIQLPHGTTQYVLVESSGQAAATAAAILEGQGATVVGGGRVEAHGHTVVSESSTSSALDALLCAVSELGQRGAGVGAGNGGEEEVVTTTVGDGEIVTTTVGDEEGAEEEEEVREEVTEGEVQVYREVMEGEEEGSEEVGMVTQVVGHAASNARHDEMVQEVLQFAASQLMMKEGLTQVIVNDEGTHYIVTELDDSTLQLEGTVYTQSTEVEQEEEVAEEEAQDTEERVVVYTEEAPHGDHQEG